MNRQDSIKAQAKAIIETHDGQTMFSLTESAKILGCHPHSVGRFLQERGILALRHGRKVMVPAVELAKAIYAHMESPLDYRRNYRPLTRISR